jgi:hypothetical protein
MDTQILSEVLVFKTNLHQKTDIEQAAALLNAHPEIARWNVDCDDVDRVLRIEATNISACDIVALLSRAGYICEELPD